MRRATACWTASTPDSPPTASASRRWSARRRASSPASPGSRPPVFGPVHARRGDRLAPSAERLGPGLATEATSAALDFGFGPGGLEEVVSCTSAGNERPLAVMGRLGMTHHLKDDFQHPLVPPGPRLASPGAVPALPGKVAG
ncbi:MAG: GNAT family N-acetyltransferase [Candidatus Dormibacteria bacterium]